MRPARLSSWVVRRRHAAPTFDRCGRNRRRSRGLNLERLEDRTLLATQPFPVPLQGLNPAGSLIDSGSVAGSINIAGDTQTYTLALAANQDVSLVLSGTSNLVGSLTLRDPGGATIAAATSAGAGQTDVLETAPVAAAGTYSLVVSGGSGSTGGYTLQVYLNAAYKPATESISTRGTAYNLSGAFVGLGTTPYADRAAVVGTSGGSSDYYALNLNAGELATLAVTGTSGESALVSLVDSSGNTLALGASGATGVDSLVSRFVAPVTGTYYAEVAGGTSGQAYDLVVTRTADFDTHGDSFNAAQPLDPFNVALGAITGAGSADWYQFNVNAGDNLVITTTTPGSTSAGGAQFVNNLRPQLQLFDSNGNLVALASGNAADGRNDVIDWTALTSGGYRVLITSADGTSTGEYTVAIQGATGGSSPFTVSSTTPAANSDLGSQQSSMTVVFNSSINDSSVVASDFSIDGQNATGFTVVNSNTVSFGFPTTANGVHNVSISGLTDVEGVSLTPDSFAFQTDDVSPSVVSSSIAEGAVLATVGVTEVVTFSEPINPSSVTASDVLLQGTLRGVGYAPASISFDPTDTILTVNYTSLPADDYTFTLEAGPANYLSNAGVPMTSSFAVDFTAGPFTVSSTTPAAGSDLGAQQSSMTVVFDHDINSSSVNTADFSIDGHNATGFTIENGNTVSFTFPTTANGVHNVSISGLTDVDGTLLTSDSFAFQTDDVPPFVVSSAIAEGQVLSSGDLTEVVTFSKPINPSSVTASDVLLQGTLRGVGYAPASMSFDPTDTILTVNYTNLPTDDYTFTLEAGPANDLSLAGVPMTSSFAVDFTLGVAVGSVQVTSPANPAAPGQPVSFTATVAPSMGGPAPGGDVQFVVDGADFGSPVAVVSGQATSQTTTTLAAGSHIVVADYLGDANYLPANSSNYSQSIQAADLSIANSGPAMASAGDPAGFDYTVVVTNNGPSDNAGGFTVTDVLPSGLTFVSAGSTPGASVVGRTVTYTNTAGLVRNATESFTLHVIVAADVPDETVLGDTASVVSNGTADVNSANNTSNTVDTTIRASADLSIAASGPATAVAGDPNGFDETLVVTNHGFLNNVGGFTVNDVLPAGVTFQSAGSTAGAVVNGTSVSFTNTSGLAYGATETFVIHLTLAASVSNGTPLENSATVVSNGTLDENPANNTSNTVDTTATAQADLRVTNTRRGSVSAGQTQTFDVTVTNVGPSDAVDVVLSDRLPQNCVIVSETQSSGPRFSVGATTANGDVTLTATNSTLGPGASATFTIVTRLASPEPDGSPLVSIASVASRTADPDPQNNESIAKALLTNAADLALHMTASPNPVAPGGTLTYALTLVNKGPNAAFDVNLRDTLPPNAVLRGVVQTSGPSFAIALPLKGTTGGVLTWSIPILESGESATFLVTVMPASTSHLLTNSAAVTSTTENQEPGDCSAIVVTAVATNPPARAIAAVVPTTAHRTKGGFGRA